ncbi:Uncharacterised protein [Staphylococcus aureus]|nr:Uncharacterised protein [Staphylococcus aureus]
MSVKVIGDKALEKRIRKTFWHKRDGKSSR